MHDVNIEDGRRKWLWQNVRTRPGRPRTRTPRKAQDQLSGKDYDRELARLHGELVKLQLWVVAKGLKVVVLFEGRDGAGKGGVIKAITERVSPRVYRVVALPAPTEREKSQMYVQRYMRHLPAAGEIVIFDRSWYNRAGVERVMEFCPLEQVKRFLAADAGGGESDRRVGDHPDQILAGGERGGADPPARGEDQRSAQGLEAVADGPQVLQPLVRLFARARRHVQGHRHGLGAVACRALRRQTARSSERHFPPLEAGPIREAAARQADIAEEAEGSGICRARLPLQVCPRTRMASELAAPPQFFEGTQAADLTAQCWLHHRRTPIKVLWIGVG